MTHEESTPTDPLFALTEYEHAGRMFFYDAQQALMKSRGGVYGQIGVESVETLPSNRVALASDRVIETAPLTVESNFALSRTHTIAGRFDDLYAAIDAAAESGLASLMPQFFAQLADICDAAGQTVNAGGRPLDHDLMYEAIAGIEIAFDDDGTPHMPTLVVHPTTAEQLAKLPPPTPEQQQRFDDMIEEKRREFFARRRTRRLPRQSD